MNEKIGWSETLLMLERGDGMMSWDFWGSLEKIFKAYGDDGYD